MATIIRYFVIIFHTNTDDKHRFLNLHVLKFVAAYDKLVIGILKIKGVSWRCAYAVQFLSADARARQIVLDKIDDLVDELYYEITVGPEAFEVMPLVKVVLDRLAVSLLPLVAVVCSCWSVISFGDVLSHQPTFLPHACFFSPLFAALWSLMCFYFLNGCFRAPWHPVPPRPAPSHTIPCYTVPSYPIPSHPVPFHQAWRDNEGGPKLAVVADDDDRLHVVLENLGLLPYFDFVLTSREVRGGQTYLEAG